MKPEIVPGRVVFSKKGRDKGRYFVVLLSLDADFVMVSDGDTRKLARMTKKRRKQLCPQPAEFPAIAADYAAGTAQDAQIRKALAPFKKGAQESSLGRDQSVQG